MKPNILLGITGSVASILTGKLTEELSKTGEVSVVLTKNAQHFTDKKAIYVPTYTDKDEWKWQERNDRILHITLREEADILLIAPLSAHTLAKIANGLCDNLLTSIFRAWDHQKPIVLAPSMNTKMWENPFTKEHLDRLQRLFPKISFVLPQTKSLMCGEYGPGALADISKITAATKEALRIP